jgi:ketosteroid isomerase-like protein
MLRSMAIFLVAGLLVIAPSARADDVRAAIDAANAKMVADYAAGDTKALAQAYTEDAVMLPPDATRVAGRSAIETLWKSWIDGDCRN